ncbi:hypothetical protein GQR58_015814 [Nymphon striatum]|nr:hypothetical protein GQR58_015814 [Nymphon striatum]
MYLKIDWGCYSDTDTPEVEMLESAADDEEFLSKLRKSTPANLTNHVVWIITKRMPNKRKKTGPSWKHIKEALTVIMHDPLSDITEQYLRVRMMSVKTHVANYNKYKDDIHIRDLELYLKSSYNLPGVQGQRANCKSMADTIRGVCAAFPVPGTLDPTHMKAIINSFNSFTNLHRKNDKERFVEFCSEQFTSFKPTAAPCPMDISSDPPPDDVSTQVQSDQLEPQPSTSVEPETPEPSIFGDTLLSPVTPSPNTRQGLMTPRKLKLKKDLSLCLTREVLKRRGT